jgi:hypothetical protein
MRIEVAAPVAAPSKIKGDLLEAFASDFLHTQNFEIASQLRVTGAELDLLCEHRIDRRSIYVECKAHRQTLDANVLKNLEGTRSFGGYDEAWLLSTGPLGKDAKGIMHQLETKPRSKRQRISIYTPARIVEAFTAAGLIKSQPVDAAIHSLKEPEKLGDWMLLLTPFGSFWVASCLEGGLPAGVLAFHATSGKLVTERALLQNLAHTDTSQNGLDFEYALRLDQPRENEDAGQGVKRVAELQFGETIDDYRPARPEHFIGREDELKKLVKFLSGTIEKQSSTRVIALTGDSGMGKSSLVIKLSARTQNVRYRRKLFVYAVDVRAATSPAYILWSLLACLRAAARLGFGVAEPQRLQLSNPSEPLESPSIQQFLTALQERHQAICLIFDQFEELYSKPELYPVFEATQRLLLSANAAQANFTVGFAWKSDSTVQQEHPAYHMWHNLADHRFEVQLLPFNAAEAGKTITLFEREFGKTLNKGLRHQIIENSRGFPWLLKKLCIHIFDQLRNGVSQSELAAKELDVKILFDRDLNRLTQPEVACIRAIAETAPADWYETLNVYGQDVVRALQNKRLVIKSGDRLNIYWDIFREYILTKEVPSVPLSYLPASPSISSLLGVARLLRGDSPATYSSISADTGLSEKTVGNVIRDLTMFGVASSEGSTARLEDSVKGSEPEVVLRKLRDGLKRHALTIALSKQKSGTAVSTQTMAQILKRLNPAAQHREHTWRIYAERMSHWLEATGYLDRDGDQYIRRDRGDVQTSSVAPRRSHGFGKVFLGDAAPKRTVEVLERLLTAPLAAEAVPAGGERNAMLILARLQLIERKDGVIRPARSLSSRQSAAELVREAARSNRTLEEVAAFLRRNPFATRTDIGGFVADRYSREWVRASKLRVGQGLAQWVTWAFPEIPTRGSPSGGYRKAAPGSSTVFRRGTPSQCIKALEWLVRHSTVSARDLRSSGHRGAVTVLRHLGLIADRSGVYCLVDSVTGPQTAGEVLRAAALQSPAISRVATYLQKRPTATGQEIGTLLHLNDGRTWSRATTANTGGDLKRWGQWVLGWTDLAQRPEHEAHLPLFRE